MNRVVINVSKTSIILIAMFLAMVIFVTAANSQTDSGSDSELLYSFGDPGFGNDVLALGSYNSDLIAGGKFFSADSNTAVRIAGWDGSSWYPFCCPSLPLGPEVYAVKQFGSDLLVGAIGITVTLHKWDGAAWGTFGTDLGTNERIYAIEEYEGQVVVAGSFRPGTLYKIARWNGSVWDSLSSGLFGAGWTAYDLLVFDSNLIVSGSFSKAGGDTALGIAQWDGANWSAIGEGLWGPNTVQTVYALTEFNGQLYAGGDFTKSGTKTLSNIAYFNGVTWQPLFGGGLDGTVYALTVYDNKLIAGGKFHLAGSTTANYIASWDGFSWSAMSNEIDSTVRSLYVHNGTLIAGGSFPNGGGGYIAAWDGVGWRAVKDFVTDAPENNENLLPDNFELAQNYPNPFNPTTEISFTLHESATTSLRVFDVTGRTVKTLVDDFMHIGNHSIEWNGTNNKGGKVASGVYFYRLSVNDSEQTKKMVLLK